MRTHLGAVLASTWLVLAAAEISAQSGLREVVVFGASAAETGNGYLATGGIVASPPYYMGRFTNGESWVEHLASRLGLPSPAPSLAGGPNFAFAGAGTGPGPSMACLGTQCSPNIGLQIETFFHGGGTLDGDELLVIEGGGNDALQSLGLHNPAITVGHMIAHVSDLARAGGKHFLIPSLPRMGVIPAIRGTSFAAQIDAWVAVYNMLLEHALQALEPSLGITVVWFDSAALFDDILSDPGAFGLTNTTDPACPGCGAGVPAPGASVVPDEDAYVFWDLFHRTRAVQALFGNAAADAVLQG